MKYPATIFTSGGWKKNAEVTIFWGYNIFLVFQKQSPIVWIVSISYMFCTNAKALVCVESSKCGCLFTFDICTILLDSVFLCFCGIMDEL